MLLHTPYVYIILAISVNAFHQLYILEARLYSVGSGHGNLYQSLVTTSRVTHFIQQAHKETRVSHN